jgi:PIN domain
MSKQIVLDANILIRGVLGKRVEPLLQHYANIVGFLTIEESFEDSGKYIPAVIKKRGGDKDVVQVSLAKLNTFRSFVQVIPDGNIAPLERVAKKRLS